MGPYPFFGKRSSLMVRTFTRFAVAASLVAAMVVGVQGQAGQRRQQAQTPAPQNTGAKKHLALVGGMLIDGYEVPPLHHAAILIEGDKIVEVGRAVDVKIPADATVIDTSGRTMMPGLIEEHAHLSIRGPGDNTRWNQGVF